jgi:hypothetical protein
MRPFHSLFVLSVALLSLSRSAAAQDEPAPPHTAAPAGTAAPAVATAAPAETAAPKEEKPDAKDEGKAGAKEEEAEPDPDVKHPVTYEIGVNVQRLSKFELGPGTFEADFLVSYTFKSEPCKPHIALANGEIKGKPDPVVDDPLHKVYRIKAELSTEVDVSDFPFDAHVLEIDIADRDEGDITFVASKESSDVNDVKLAGWNIEGTTSTVESEDLGGGLKASHFVYAVDLKRPGLAAFAKNFLPAFTMVLVLFIALFMKPKMAAARLAAGTGSFVAVIMFHNTAAGQLPPLGFLTRLDKFMFSLYLVWLLHITFSILILRADEKKDEAMGEKLYKTAWMAVPGLAVLGWLLVFAKIV